MNRVTLYGNLGQDPELKVTAGGQSILKLSLATSEVYFDKNNVKQEKTEWHRVSVWGKRADGLAKILGKGMKVLVEGSLRTSSYEKDGEKRYSTEVNAREVWLPGKGSGSRDNDTDERPGNARSGGGQRRPPQTFGGNNGPPEDDFGGGGFEPDGDIPF